MKLNKISLLQAKVLSDYFSQPLEFEICVQHLKDIILVQVYWVFFTDWGWIVKALFSCQAIVLLVSNHFAIL